MCNASIGKILTNLSTGEKRAINKYVNDDDAC